MTQTPAPTLAVQPVDSAAPASDEAATVNAPKATGFSSLFSAAKAASGKLDDQPWHQKGNKSAHEKKIGPAPNGTRRSMGKR
ncbi:hypothetical protein [Pseudomonas leptonychotis]|jgi:hypothetical protein|uniref:Uncharacterized protein n=1 Tax=Pseudomonas leptonychotis TaxID=2448482 RepID=A0A4T1ZXZ2_9PSED|nr:hypothetical protein [Pseudomonas leptonychotis]TIH09430.1 hypothetical protein D8779_01550 [Pseudomonas leptonychotis]|tara:strand:- start:989 stop:1234 length:246 start_codon:yes stop_codon:yes gene_type:complete